MPQCPIAGDATAAVLNSFIKNLLTTTVSDVETYAVCYCLQKHPLCCFANFSIQENADSMRKIYNLSIC